MLLRSIKNRSVLCKAGLTSQFVERLSEVAYIIIALRKYILILTPNPNLTKPNQTHPKPKGGFTNYVYIVYGIKVYKK